MTKRMVAIWQSGWGVLLDGSEPAVIRANSAVREMLEHSWRGYMAYRGLP